MSELKTLSKSDPEFARYLMGSFSSTERALPVQSLNVATENEVVTFRIVPVSQIERPPFFKRWAQTLKLKNLVLLGFPLFLILVRNRMEDAAFNGALALLSALGACFLFLSFNLRNDCRDHVSGLDRIHPQSGSRAIQNGWITAAQAQRLSLVFASLGLVCGLPSLIVFPKILIPIIIGLGIALLGLYNYGMGLKYRSWTEVSVFILLGPLLTVSYQWAIGGNFDLETLFFGVISGWFAVFLVHLKNFEAIMANDQAGFGNTVRALGFEKSKILILTWWLVLILLMDGYHWIYAAPAWALGIFVITLSLTWILVKNLRQLKSPVSSSFGFILQRLGQIAMVLVSVWILESMTYLLVMELAT